MTRWQTDDHEPQCEGTTDLPLFDAPAPRDLLVHRDDPPASRLAALTAKERAATARIQVLGILAMVGSQGYTAHEIDGLMGWRTPSGSPAGRRLSELLRDAPPRVARLKETRRTSTGSPSHVHVLTDHVAGRETV